MWNLSFHEFFSFAYDIETPSISERLCRQAVACKYCSLHLLSLEKKRSLPIQICSSLTYLNCCALSCALWLTQKVKVVHSGRLVCKITVRHSFFCTVQCPVHVIFKYWKCSNWCRILKLSWKFGCLFTFCYLDGANSIKPDLHNCNLWTGQVISYRSKQNSKK